MKQKDELKKITTSGLSKFPKKNKYMFIKIKTEKIIIPPNKGVPLICNFLTLSGMSIRLVL